MILAFGDSLTNGFGATFGNSYPKFMEKKTALKIKKAGVNGEFSEEGLKRLPKFLVDKPELVILCHGANDIGMNRSASELHSNLVKMIKMIQDVGAKVLLVGVPDFTFPTTDTHVLYDDIAHEMDVMYEDEVLSEIMGNKELRVDFVHPNDDGYELMADKFIEVLKENNLLN